jgi:hypothetical protein
VRQPFTPEERDDYLQGQIHALTAFVQALVTADPNRAVLLEVFEALLLKTEANTLALPLTDAHLEGMRAVQSLLYARGTNPAERK